MGNSPIFIDTDIALGRAQGDCDDGLAMAHVLASNCRVAGVGSVFGNTRADCAADCARALIDCAEQGARVCVYRGAAWPGQGPTPASRFIQDSPERLRILAIGPLTNVAHALTAGASGRIESITILGTNRLSRGFLPPVWPFEFNLTKDRWATKIVFRSELPIKVVPLDVARTLLIDQPKVDGLPKTRTGELIRTGVSRWLARNRRIGKRAVPAWDLVAAFWLLHPELCRDEQCAVAVLRFGRISYRNGTRPIVVLREFNPEQAWQEFVKAVGRLP